MGEREMVVGEVKQEKRRPLTWQVMGGSGRLFSATGWT